MHLPLPFPFPDVPGRAPLAASPRLPLPLPFAWPGLGPGWSPGHRGYSCRHHAGASDTAVKASF
uniref:Uncharacterized protein n=1 Tax=Oryza barthii TaxID=65489 RepID=A0A0D3FQA6_9ORYZ